MSSFCPRSPPRTPHDIESSHLLGRGSFPDFPCQVFYRMAVTWSESDGFPLGLGVCWREPTLLPSRHLVPRAHALALTHHVDMTLTTWPGSCLSDPPTVEGLCSPPFPPHPLWKEVATIAHRGGAGLPLYLLEAGGHDNRLELFFMGEFPRLPSLFICSIIYLVSMSAWLF